MNDEKAESSTPWALAEEVLLAEFQRQVTADPQLALETVNRLVLKMHSASCEATDAARMTGTGWHEIGRAHAALEGAGILLRQAAALFLGGPAADRAAEWEMLTQALGEETCEGDDEAQLPEDGCSTPVGEDIWSAAVGRFRRNTRFSLPSQ
ncbi:hypothetical protein OHB13_38460 (plasmid) [Streptomyces sp. NBC_00440]|uniref:hypothetical protein n=1 Tax=Streptomyces sp. NBC_00440 TaxID=2975741 RepID=UPI002E1B6B1A